MKKLKLLLPLVFGVAAFQANAQLQFKLTYNDQTERYTVAVIPSVSYLAPNNITGTGQVTIRVPSNEFFPVDIQNGLESMIWDANSRNDAPDESPDNDYISFGLVINGGLAFPDYIAGQEMALFSFKNALGCTGKVAIVDNVNDPFMPPNSQNANIGNTITILGAGGDAYGGIIGSGETNCAETPAASPEEVNLESVKVFPNPTPGVANVEINWIGETTDATLYVMDASGKKVVSENITLMKGAIARKLDITAMAAGSYLVYLEGTNWKLSLDKITKQ